MENKTAQTTSFLPSLRGAGGKLKKPPRRPSPTPYARPPRNQTQRGGRWLHKLVDPAFRLIASGANLILPSFLSKSQYVNALPAPTDEKDDHDNLHAMVGQNASGDDDDSNFTGNHMESRTTELAGSSRIADRSNSHSDFNEHEFYQKVDVSNPNGLSEIEKLMKDKRFSRDEINHLIEIIKSRVVDLPNVDQENKYLSSTAGDLNEPAIAVEYSGKSAEAKQGDLERGVWETSKVKERKYASTTLEDARRPANALEYSRKHTETKHEDLDGVIWKTSTPLMQSKLRNDIGTSPVEIARAYMDNRISEVDFDTSSLISKEEGTLLCRDELALKPVIPSPAPKSPCWPGALVQDQRGYMTPQSQRGRFGLHNFPRTPYSRPIYSKTKSRFIQLQSNNDRHHNPMVTPFQQTQTPVSEQVNSKGDALNDGRGSVGPIRRMQNKVNAYTHNPRGSAFSCISLKSPQMENFSVSEGLFSAPKSNLGNIGTNSSAKFQSAGTKPQSSEVSTPTVPSHSSLVARKILEHLERNPPTPKDKSVELRLATSGKKPLLSDPTFMPNQLNSLTHSDGLDSSEKSVQVPKNDSQNSANEVNFAVNNNTSSASEMNSGTASTHFDYGGPSQDFRKSLDSKLINSHEDVSNSKVGLNAAGSELFSFQKKLPRQSSGTKPVLPTISINKRDQRWTISSDNSSGFTFPVSTTSGASAEPPTPSILPSSSSIGLNQNEGSPIPSYSFGSRRSTTALVFSFPSTSNVPTNDASELKFKFGSDESTTISFSSIGKDAICY